MGLRDKGTDDHTVYYAMSNEVLCLRPKNLMSSASMHKIMVGSLVSLQVGDHLTPFPVLDRGM